MEIPDRIEVLAEGRNRPVARGAYLRWPVPLRGWFSDGAASTEALDWHWRFFQFVFPLADPRSFPTLTEADLTDDELRRLRRYVRHARNLAQTSVLSTTSGYEVSLPTMDAEPEIEQHGVVPEDATIGFLTMLRQCYAPEEEASFMRCYHLISREVHRAGIDPQNLQAWKGAQGKMRGYHLDYLILRQAAESGLVPQHLPERSAFAPDGQEDSPEQVLSKIFYGGAIHWGRHATVVDSWDEDHELVALKRRFFAIRNAAQLAHLYIGFAAIVGRAIGELDEQDI